MRTFQCKLFLRMSYGACVLAAFLWIGGFALYGQTQTQTSPSPASGSGQGRVSVGSDEESDNPMVRHAAEVAQKKRNEQRQQQIVKDTERLALLAQQLRDEVAKSDKNTLSVAVVKKAEEIEKLARSVKDKMKAE